MLRPTDTIPRIHQLIPHARAQLVDMTEGQNTFEECRLRYGATQRELELREQGRTTVTRVPESDRNWSPARDLLQEFARWGAIEESRLPSGRQFIDPYRAVRYPLTAIGRKLAEAAATSQRDFADQVTQLLLKVHPYLQNLVAALAAAPIVVPVVGERDLQRFRGKGLSVDDVAKALADERRMNIEPAALANELRRYWQRFRGREPDDKPSNKELCDATNKALLATCFAAAGVPVDSETIRTLLRWGAQLALYDQSRYVPAHSGSQTIWLCADVDLNDPPSVGRRGLAAHGENVARAIVVAYEEQAKSADSHMDKPVLPIYLVRAQAACSQRVTRRLCDLVLSRMVDGEYPQLGAQPALFVGNTVPLPRSERPPFRHHNQRRMTLQINLKEDA